MKRKVIPNHNHVPRLDVFLTELRTYLEDSNCILTVTNEEQEAIIKRMQGNADRGKFGFVMDGLNERIKHHTGVQKWLGYSDGDFTFW